MRLGGGCRVVNDHAIRSGRYVDQPVVHPATSRIQASNASVAGWLVM
jgi:hypothetical protein